MINNSARAVKDYPARSKRFAMLCLFLLVLFCAGFGRQVVIVSVPEGDKIVTADGDTLVLANVQAVSVNDPDSLRRALALKSRAFLEKQVLNQSVFIEYAADESPRLVYILKRQYSIGSINAQILRKGYGYFVPEPNSKYSSACRDAGDYAKSHYLGVYHLDLQPFYKPIPKTSCAFWLNGGVGLGGSWRQHDSALGFIKGEIAGHYRWHQWLFSGGIADGADLEGDGSGYARSGYFTIGRSAFDRFFEASLSTGLAITQVVYYFVYDDCCDPDLFDNRPRVIRRHPGPAWVIQAQWLVHPFKAGPAVGMSLDWNLNRDISYLIISVNVALGAWNFQVARE